MIDYKVLNQLLYDGKADAVREWVERALSEGHSLEEVLAKGLIDGMRLVGEDFKHNRIFVPQVLVAARAMRTGMAVLQPLLTETTAAKPISTVVMGTVKGDLHDIGKNLVCMMSEGAGLRVIDLGVDQTVDRFLAAAREHNADLVGMSALLTTTMPYMKVVIDGFKAEGLDHVKLCVGGAPLNEGFAAEIGAHGYAADAPSAVDLFSRLSSSPETT
ncbi:MAG: corrinoid protein [Gemmatimonadales bacterium]|jgi:5-methyltetrahydrofolate--homocysteine methyltransferase